MINNLRDIISKINILTIAMVLVTYLILPQPIVSASTAGAIVTYNTPTANWRARFMVTGHDGSVWTSETNNKKIAKTTSTGITTEFSLPANYSKPDNLTIGPEGALWFSAFKSGVNSYNNAYAVGRVSVSGDMTFYDLPVPSDRSTYFSSVLSLTIANGTIWVVREYSKNLQKMGISGIEAEVINVAVGRPAGVDQQDYDNGHYVGQIIAYSPRDGNLYLLARHKAPSNSTISHYVQTLSTAGLTISSQALGYSNTDYYVPSKTAFDTEGMLWFIGGSYLEGEKIGYYNPDTGLSELYPLPDSNFRAGSIVLGLDGKIWITERNKNNTTVPGKVASVDLNGNFTETSLSPNLNYPYGLAVGVDGDLWVSQYSLNKITRYGTGVTAFPDTDLDGLSADQELIQGSSDFAKDSDNDGLSDQLESVWYGDRNQIFCNSSMTNCEYPDPLRGDIYIEYDWMVKPASGNDPGYTTQPSQAQFAWLENAFSYRSINYHADIGQLGGGNEVPYLESMWFDPGESTVTFVDYRDGTDGMARNFSEARHDIYRYAILGDGVSVRSGEDVILDVTGVSLEGTDDMFISYGTIYENPGAYSSFDIALAGTLIHELGHGLCLESFEDDDDLYEGQNPECRFDGIDTSDVENYASYYSSMNYIFQTSIVDYSDGLLGENDHNDWGAIGLEDYTTRETFQYGATLSELAENNKRLKEKGIRFEYENGKYKIYKQGTLIKNERTTFKH